MASRRTPLQVTLSVWKALLLREALTRLFSQRASWFWLVAEPMAHIAIMSVLFTVIRQRTVGNMDAELWLVLGLTGFFLFRRAAIQGGAGISSNRSLFVYRQITPVDAVLVRSVIELLVMVLVMIIAFTALLMFGIDITPYDPIGAVVAFLGLWFLGVGFGLILSVAAELVPELGSVIKMMMRPVYLLSGVIIPLSAIPEPYRSYLMYNPVSNGLEAMRAAFSEFYHEVPSTSLSYVYICALFMIVVGLMGHRVFRREIIAK
ncbi:ABC transporter permease [Croceicoccus sediminis]|uniref:ABC transporter permease n=1 Tax=Croceicoccus sediminis TaxID=2571150 RepID=UPI001183B9C4|nr:ABC transporter permease [Croceicoccus sediminis]